MTTDKKTVHDLALLFRGLSRAYGQYIITGAKQTGKIEGRATTVLGQVGIDLWVDHLHGKKGLGIVPIMDDGRCWWGAIDIDKYPLDIPAIEARCKELNLPIVPCRTKSGGVHLFLFGKEPLLASLVRSKLLMIAAKLGYPGVEIFPKQVRLASTNDVGNWLNMPYYSDEKTDRYCILGGKPVDLATFVQRAVKLQVTEEQLDQLSLQDDAEAFSDGPPCLQNLARSGFPAGTRNSGMFAVGVYLRLKFPDDWEREMDPCNQKHMTPPLAAKEVIMVSRSVARKAYFYPCDKAPLLEHCSKELCRSRHFGIGEGNQDDPGVNIGALVKLLTIPPVWIIDVDGVRMELDTDDLLSQDRFRKHCVENINTYPNRVKAPTWEKMVRDRLQNVEKVEAPEDAGNEGRMWFLLDQFCTGMTQARVQEEILAGKPWTERGRTFFRGQDFFRFLEQQHFRGLSNKSLWAALRRRGAEHHAFMLKGRCVQCWSVPEFPLQNMEFSVPNVQGDF